MSGIGFWELIILFLIGLIVLGPERLPRVANQLGTWLGQARRMTRVMKRQLEDELNLEDQMRLAPPSAPHNEGDDTYSPAHGRHGAGTGVGDDGDQPEDAPSDDEGPAETTDNGPAKESS
ncbi:MAG: Sec-independent protein translocase protein TatB [Woeseia sp.]